MKSRANVVDFGAVPDGKSLSTRAIQAAIDSLPEEGGIVTFPEGEFVLSTIHLRSNLTLIFHANCKILGSLNFYDFERDEAVDYPLYQDASHSYFHSSLFVAENCHHIHFQGGYFDMRSVWDEEDVRGLRHRGCKCVAMKNCSHVTIENTSIYNATDLAVYLAGCSHCLITGVSMRTYIDGISPDCCEDVEIRDCDVESGDDGIVLKSSYTLNELRPSIDIFVHDCRVKSQCNALKLGTESNGDFRNIRFQDIEVYETRISGISIETVDGGNIDCVTFENIRIRDSGTPMFMMVGNRLRGPEGTKVGSISNVLFRHIRVDGSPLPKRYECVPAFYVWAKEGLTWSYPSILHPHDETIETGNWQITSNFFGLPESPLRDISLDDVELRLDGGVNRPVPPGVPKAVEDYPEANVHGGVLPALGLYVAYGENIATKNVRVIPYHPDVRPDIVMDEVWNGSKTPQTN